MKPIGQIIIPTIIPERIKRLSDIANNLWWTWNCEVVDLFKSIDSSLWERSGANPVAFLKRIGSKKLEHMADNGDFLQSYDDIVRRFDDYMNCKDTWFARTYPGQSDQTIAYFSAEYGLNETLPIYSGGLGVLSGDHCKSASDLGLPFTAVGLFYRQGYFNQLISFEGIQETSYSTLNISELPIKPVVDENGDKILISLDLPGRVVHASIWLVKVGRVNLYLLDTDVPMNSDNDRSITSRLYGGDGDTRIQQEMLLGIGGIRALNALGIKPVVYHMNEGHSAFLAFELIRKWMQEDHLSFREACEMVRSSCVFTIHTPVPAGIDVFSYNSIDMYFSSFREMFGISREEFMELGSDGSNHFGFNMAYMAMKMTYGRNGVSKLHGEVTRRMFNNLWPQVPEKEVPITHVTNGIHTLTWLSQPYKKLFDKYLPLGWENLSDDKSFKDSVDSIPDEELWQEHMKLKKDMADYINNRIKLSTTPSSASSSFIRHCSLIDPDVLTIGFSRRFATYKRAALIFRDIERIKKILNAENMPVQIIFAGKAHPADKPAQDVIKYINDISEQEGFEGKVFLLENYNIALARRLVQSVDVWLNNPRMPLEASGTSGMKAGLNGVINLSILDGWWREGYNGSNGWAIGTETVYNNESYQDNSDSESLYEILEDSLAPAYYDRNAKGIPLKWVKIMKESITSLSAQFSTHRMLRDYTSTLYMPSIERTAMISGDGRNDFSLVSELSQWKKRLKDNWHGVSISSAGVPARAAAEVGEIIIPEAVVSLGILRPEDVSVEFYYTSQDSDTQPMVGKYSLLQPAEEINTGTYRYKGELHLPDSGEYNYSFRVIPAHRLLSDKFGLRLVKWAEK